MVRIVLLLESAVRRPMLTRTKCLPTLLLNSARRPWYLKFRLALNACQSVEDIEGLLCRQVNHWRGKAGRLVLGAPPVGSGHEGEGKTRDNADLEDLGDILNCPEFGND